MSTISGLEATLILRAPRGKAASDAHDAAAGGDPPKPPPHPAGLS